MVWCVYFPNRDRLTEYQPVRKRENLLDKHVARSELAGLGQNSTPLSLNNKHWDMYDSRCHPFTSYNENVEKYSPSFHLLYIAIATSSNTIYLPYSHVCQSNMDMP